jgi:hypothetical protein
LNFFLPIIWPLQNPLCLRELTLFRIHFTIYLRCYTKPVQYREQEPVKTYNRKTRQVSSKQTLNYWQSYFSVIITRLNEATCGTVVYCLCKFQTN